MRDLLDGRLGPEHSLLSNLTVGVPYVLFSALGLFAPLLVILAIRLRKRASAVLVLFPLLLVANFLAMFLGLALDLRSSTPDELSHRPVMIVYFVVVAWVGGAAGLLLLESRRLGRIARPALVCLAVSLLAVPGAGRLGRPAHVGHADVFSRSRPASAWSAPPSTCAITATATTSSRTLSSTGPAPWRPWRSGATTPRGP